MIYLELLLGFLKVGLFSFGGAYAAIPLIREVVLSHGWMTEETLTYMIAISESTPGPIMVNLATYVGSAKAGIGGAAVATLAVILPAFLLILFIASLFRNATENPWVKAILRGMKPAVIGVILATGAYMALENCYSVAGGLDPRATVITLILLGVTLTYKLLRQRKFPPILLILASAILGMVAYSL